MMNPKTVTLLFFIGLLCFLLFYNKKSSTNLKNNNKEHFNIKRDILSNVDVFTKYMLLNDYK